MIPVKIIQGSILDAQTDTIVNPANSFLHHTGGLARVIAEAATPSPYSCNRHEHSVFYYDQRNICWWDEQNFHPNVPTGGAAWTSAGALPYAGIVHAVGPIWGGGEFYEHELLYEAHMSALNLAETKGCKSVAFPAISCGIFGFPVEEAALTAFDAFDDFTPKQGGLELVEVYLFEDAHVDAYRAALDTSAGLW